MTLLTEPILNLEDIQREAFLQLFDHLNDNIDLVGRITESRDIDFASRTNRDYVPLDVEHIAETHFYEAAKPALAESKDSADFPACSVWLVRSLPTNESALLDQVSVKRNLIYVEVLVKSDVSEQDVNKKLLRTAEAVNLTFKADESLNNIVNSNSEPTISISDIFIKREGTTRGPQFFMQGARLEFTVDKGSVNSPNNFSQVEQVSGASRIDYSKFIDQE